MYRIGQEEIDAVARVIRSRRIFKTEGTEVFSFERELGTKMGVPYAVMMTSGKASLISALTALGVGPGDEVIIPCYTYIASAIAVTAVGAIPIICDIDATMTMDPADAERKISPATKAIMPVHIQGFPCNLDAILALAKKRGIAVVEDACQADGGAYKGKRLGTLGDAGAFSFNHYKIITAGEGGAMVTHSRQLHERALIYHDSSAIAYFGGQLDNVTEPQFCGVEYRANEISAAILREQLKKLDGILNDLRTRKKAIVAAVKDVLMPIPSNDIEGDCGTTMAFQFTSAEKAAAFAAAPGVDGTCPVNTGKHVYTNWTPLLEKRGAFNPKSDPFKLKENQGLQFNITPDACPKSLDLLARTVYVMVSPDWAEQETHGKITALRAAANE